MVILAQYVTENSNKLIFLYKEFKQFILTTQNGTLFREATVTNSNDC